MAVVNFTRTNQVTGEVINFSCNLVYNATVPTPKEQIENELNYWLKSTKDFVHTLHTIKATKDDGSQGIATIYYDEVELYPTLLEATKGGADYNLSLSWVNPQLIKYFFGMSISYEAKMKRAINGILEKKFNCLPIFDPMNDQDVVVLESDIYPLVVAFQTHLASL